MLKVIPTQYLNRICGGDQPKDTVTVVGGGGAHGGGGTITINQPVTPDTSITVTTQGNTDQGVTGFMIGVNRTWG